MDIKIKVTNHFTKEVIIDSVAKGITGDWLTVEQNQKVFAQAYPDCYVNFVQSDSSNGIWGMPVNQKRDEEAMDRGEMTWNEYCDKWYSGNAAIRDTEELKQEDFNIRDSVCY
jgi:hypothetical protein